MLRTRGARARAERTHVHRAEGLALCGVPRDGSLRLAPCRPASRLHPARHRAIHDRRALDLRGESALQRVWAFVCRTHPGGFHVPDDCTYIHAPCAANSCAEGHALFHSCACVVLSLLDIERLVPLFATSAKERFALKSVILRLRQTVIRVTGLGKALLVCIPSTYGTPSRFPSQNLAESPSSAVLLRDPFRNLSVTGSVALILAKLRFLYT